MSVNLSTEYTAGATAYAAAAADSKAAEAASSAEKEAKTESKKNDSFEKSTQYKMDTDKVNAMKAGLSSSLDAFRMLVEGLLNKQGKFSEIALGDVLIDIDAKTRADAQAAIADDGEWGVEATATRILDFAKALAGGDPSKIDSMRDAFQQGFAAAEKAFGGKLPEISYKTYDRVMQGFDDWANEGKEVSAE